ADLQPAAGIGLARVYAPDGAAGSQGVQPAVLGIAGRAPGEGTRSRGGVGGVVDYSVSILKTSLPRAMSELIAAAGFPVDCSISLPFSTIWANPCNTPLSFGSAVASASLIASPFSTMSTTEFLISLLIGSIPVIA